MAAKKTAETTTEETAKPKLIKTVIEDTEVTEELHETVTLTETFARHGSIVTRFGIIEFIDGQATVSTALAEELRQQGFVV